MANQGSKPEYWYQQSAVVPYIIDDEEIKVVVITSLGRKRWIVPKGIIENELSPEDSAAKEALEEAGVIGQATSVLLGEYQRRKWGGICHIRVYPMKVEKILDRWEEMGVRERQVLPLDEAVGKVNDGELKRIIRELPEHIFPADGI